MYQRHRCTIFTRKLAEAESTAGPEGLRMVCRAVDEHHARDGGACDESCGGGRMSRLWRHSVCGHKEPYGFLCVIKETPS